MVLQKWVAGTEVSLLIFKMLCLKFFACTCWSTVNICWEDGCMILRLLLKKNCLSASSNQIIFKRLFSGSFVWEMMKILHGYFCINSTIARVVLSHFFNSIVLFLRDKRYVRSLVTYSMCQIFQKRWAWWTNKDKSVFFFFYPFKATIPKKRPSSSENWKISEVALDVVN